MRQCQKRSEKSKVQRTASAAVKWISSHGGRIQDPDSDTVAKLSKLGCSGKWAANAERDCHRLMRKMDKWLGAKIVERSVRVMNRSTLEVAWEKMPMILPHDMCLALWNQGPHVFGKCLFGDLTGEEVKEYWDHLEARCAWFQQHPACKLHDRSKLAGVATYGDEIQAYRNSECGSVAVCAWTAELAYKNDPLLRYFPICLWSEHHECEHTYSDAMKYVVRSFRRLCDSSADWPWTREGYHFAFTSAQGDLKWINERMGLHNYRRNEFCSRCMCTKTSPNGNVYESLTSFSDDPHAFPFRDYSGVDLVQEFSVLFSLPLAMERVMHDTCHSQLLGTGKTTNGPALIHLIEAGMYGPMQGPGVYQEKLAKNLRRAHRDFLLYKKIHKLQCSQPRFTPARLNRKVQTSNAALLSQ